ncbi:MAG: 4-alpha-glucanotransferase [Lentisphaerae bacterium]|nr:4-alpha-glucanotransferase [Lentisphaerota bacterium]
MHIRFSIHYETKWGDEVRLVGSSPELGEWNVHRAPPMVYTPGGNWVLSLPVTRKTATAFAYKYCILHAGGGVEWEWGVNRESPARVGRVSHVLVSDIWRAQSAPENALCTAAFSRAILGGERVAVPGGGGQDGKGGLRCRFRVTAPRVPAGHVLCLMGSDPALGAWDEGSALPMAGEAFPEWTIDVRLKTRHAPVYYKYGHFDPQTRRVTHWEAGDNRSIWPDPVHKGSVFALRNDGMYRLEGAAWRGAGVAIPVFSLRSDRGLGVGEFADIKGLVDWARATGIKMIQLLPVNDTVATHTWVDSYPYAAVSVFALHPIYMRLDDMDVLDAEVTRAFIEPHRAALNALAEVDYEAVMAAKSRYYKMAYDAGRDRFLGDAAYRRFFEENRSWLVPYAAFSCLRDRYGTSNYAEWPDHRTVSESELAAFTSPSAPHYDDVAVHYFIQYHLHRQLLDAATYARAHGVALKGDIPIGVYRHSVDTWVDRRSFNLNSQAGAPPDDFAIDGQNWGFPTYNWDVMAEDGFAWWRRRLTHLATYFDAFRIDHILGFFRIWEIPLEHVQGIMGHFSPAFTISRAELASRGMWFDRERLCRPYIRRHMLGPIFGPHADLVARQFLDEYQPGCFHLKPGFTTQRHVEERLAQDARLHPENRELNESLKWGLFRLIAEVVFLEDPRDAEVFYPRHSFQRTYAFAELDGDTQWKLNALYIDYFYKRHETFWREQALNRLPAVCNATHMLICGEDLGMVPDCVPGVMQALGILSLFIQRMPKDPRREYSHPADCPYLSVCSPSTHDMSTLRGWWEEDRERTQRFFNVILGRWGTAPTTGEPWICREIVAQHLYSPSMWAVFPLQDLLAMDGARRRRNAAEERINVPSNPRHYWRYRMHLTLESLCQASDFNTMLKDLISQAGRNVGA